MDPRSDARGDETYAAGSAPQPTPPGQTKGIWQRKLRFTRQLIWPLHCLQVGEAAAALFVFTIVVFVTAGGLFLADVFSVQAPSLFSELDMSHDDKSTARQVVVVIAWLLFFPVLLSSSAALSRSVALRRELTLPALLRRTLRKLRTALRSTYFALQVVFFIAIVPVGFVALYALWIRGRYQQYEQLFFLLSILISALAIIRILPLLLAPFLAVLRERASSRIYFELRSIPFVLHVQTVLATGTFVCWTALLLHFPAPATAPTFGVTNVSYALVAVCAYFYSFMAMNFVALQLEAAKQLRENAQAKPSEQQQNEGGRS